MLITIDLKSLICYRLKNRIICVIFPSLYIPIWYHVRINAIPLVCNRIYLLTSIIALCLSVIQSLLCFVSFILSVYSWLLCLIIFCFSIISIRLCFIYCCLS